MKKPPRSLKFVFYEKMRVHLFLKKTQWNLRLIHKKRCILFFIIFYAGAVKSIKVHHKFVGCEPVWACAQIHEKKNFQKIYKCPVEYNMLKKGGGYKRRAAKDARF